MRFEDMTVEDLTTKKHQYMGFLRSFIFTDMREQGRHVEQLRKQLAVYFKNFGVRVRAASSVDRFIVGICLVSIALDTRAFLIFYDVLRTDTIVAGNRGFRLLMCICVTDS